MKSQILKKQHLTASPEARSRSSGAWLHCTVRVSELIHSHCTLNLKSIFFKKKTRKSLVFFNYYFEKLGKV